MKSLKDILGTSLKKIVSESTMRQSSDSVDAMLDSILLGYKGDSLQEGTLDKYFSMILEAPLDDPMADEEPEGEDAPPPDQTTGDDELDAEESAPTRVPKIDIDQFAQKVVNLSENYQNLIDIRSVIINRSVKVLSEAGYSQNTIAEYKSILEREFDIKIGLDGFADEKNEIPRPPPGMGAGAEIG